jgi:hypothetical protein
VLYGRCIGSQGGTIEDRSTGRSVKTVNIPFDRLATDPILVDRSSFLSPGENQITLSPSAEMQNALVLVSATHWVPWEKTRIRSSPQLQLSARFDRLDVRAGDSVRCSVSARRVGFRGYGMMLAEIGLPPGTEVDRASLESVVEDASPGVDRYEVLPDRVVFCLGLRSPMKAKSAPSVLYDYYNPEALSEIPPFRWVVKN